MLLDIGTMNNIEIDEDNQLAIVQPGARSIQLMAAARDKGLHFPVPHCPTVGIAGFTTWSPITKGIMLMKLNHVSTLTV